MWWFFLLKTLHILAAITAVGANLTYAVWSQRGTRDPRYLGFALRGIKFLDQRIANPAYGLLLVTGLLMAFLQYSITISWILIGLGLYVLLFAVAGAVYTPTLNRQIAAVDADGGTSPAYTALAGRAAGTGMFLGVVAIAAVFVMVFKP